MVESTPDASNLPIDAPIGAIVNEKYQIERILGVGGSAIVTAARHLALNELVALKFLLSPGTQNPESVMRFSREARTIAKLKNEHVVRAFDVGTLPSGTPYLVMEYLQGCDVSSLMLANGALRIEQAVEFVLQACEALAEAHGFGIIHRDLKPANLYCCRRTDGLESIKVLDFGSSKIGDSSASSSVRMTLDRTIVGTPLYMSPEQMVSSHDVDERSDIWSLGVSLYEMLTLRAPFYAESVLEIIVKTASEPPPPLHKLRGDIPPALEATILTCLEKDRSRRYANVAEFALALTPFGSRHADRSVERIERTLRVSGLFKTALSFPRASRRTELQPSLQTTTLWTRTTSQRQRRTGTFLARGAGGLVIVGLVALSAYFVKGSSVTHHPKGLLVPPSIGTSSLARPSPGTDVALPPRMGFTREHSDVFPGETRSRPQLCPSPTVRPDSVTNNTLASKKFTQPASASVPNQPTVTGDRTTSEN